MAIPSNQTLLDEAFATTCFTKDTRESQQVELAGYLAACVSGTPLNPDLTQDQLASVLGKIACLPAAAIQSIIVNQFARVLWLIQPSTPNYLYDDVSDLRTLSYDSAIQKRSYQINGLDAPWDGNGRFYAWDPTYVGVDNGISVIILNDTAGRPGAMRALQ